MQQSEEEIQVLNKLDSLAKAKREASGFKKSYSVCYAEVLKENAALYMRYLRAKGGM